MTDNNKNFSTDEELSDFADHVLKGQMKNTASDSNEELRGLEETILRLHNNMASSALEESTKKQMLVRLNARIRREKEQVKKKPFWTFFKESGPQFNSQFLVVFGVIALLIVTMVISPLLENGGSSTTVGTALNSNSNIFISVGLVAIIIGILWYMRRK
jgi:hypothetical protein